MATFHSTDRWFVLGIVILVFHFLLLSGWYSLRHVLYSQLWALASISKTVDERAKYDYLQPLARIVFAILFLILHSKLSNPAVLLAAALWNLISLAILSVASVRTHIHVSNVLESGQKSTLAFLRVIQYLPWAAVLFFASATGCWVRDTVTPKKRTFIRKAARVLNWTGGSMLILCFAVTTTAGICIVFWSLRKKRTPVPALLVTYGSFISAPFTIVRLVLLMIWMGHRNSIGADYGAYAGGGVVMEFMMSFVNLLVAWYTFGMTQDDTFVRTHNLQERKERMILRGIKFRDGGTAIHDTRRGSLVRSALSLASASTIASFTRSTSVVPDRRTDRPFSSKFVVRTTGRDYRIDDGNTLIRSIRCAYKDFHTISDSTLSQQPYQLRAGLIRGTAQAVLEQVARLLWLFTLWEALDTKDAVQRRALETDIKSVWYEDFSAMTGLEAPPVHSMRSFSDISEAVLGVNEKRPVDKMLQRVFLHFFDRLKDYDVKTRASLCLFALRLVLKQDLTKAQNYQPSFTNNEEANILDVSEDMRHNFDRLAASTARSVQSSLVSHNSQA